MGTTDGTTSIDETTVTTAQPPYGVPDTTSTGETMPSTGTGTGTSGTGSSGTTTG